MRRWLAWWLVAAVVTGASEAGAQRRRVKDPEWQESAVAAALASRDRAKLGWALGEIVRVGPQAAGQAGALEGLLRRGLPVELAQQAISALGATRQGARVMVLKPYVRHRAVEVRLATMTALGQLGGGALLLKGLQDEHEGVRGQAALALGKACEGAQCEGLIAMVGVIPLSTLGPGLATLWARHDAAATDELKGKLMERLSASTDPVAAEVIRLAKEQREQAEVRRKRAPQGGQKVR